MLPARRLAAFAVAAAFAAPLASPSQAQPPAHAPAYGYGKNKNRRGNADQGIYDRDRYDNGYGYDNGQGDGTPDEYGYNPNPGYNNPGYGNGSVRNGDFRNGDFRGRRTFEGVVSRDLTGSRFVMRADDGRVLNVSLRREETRGLSVGDRVRVSGYFRDDTNRNRNNAEFDADVLQVLGGRDGIDYGNGGYGTSRNVSFPATVISRSGNRRLSVRGDNGRTYTIESRSSSTRFDNGDRVRIEGTSRASNGVITDARVTLLRDGDIFGDGREGTFLGRVQRVDTRAGTITVRDDNGGRTYTFRPKEPGDFRVGQRVEATLGQRDGRTVLTKVTRR
jgi:outer membrane lipoprotein SlyB